LITGYLYFHVANPRLNLLKNRMLAQCPQIGIFSEPFEIVVAQSERSFESFRGSLDFPIERVAAREIVEHQRVVRLQPGEPLIHLQTMRHVAALAVMVSEHLQRLDIMRVAANQPLEECDFHIQLTAFTASQLVVFNSTLSRHTTVPI